VKRITVREANQHHRPPQERPRHPPPNVQGWHRRRHPPPLPRLWSR